MTISFSELVAISAFSLLIPVNILIIFTAAKAIAARATPIDAMPTAAAAAAAPPDEIIAAPINPAPTSKGIMA